MEDGRTVDVTELLSSQNTIDRVQFESLVYTLETQHFTDVNFGRLRKEYKDALNAIRKDEGVDLLVDDNLVIPAKVVEKFYKKRMFEAGYSAEKMAELLVGVFHKDVDFASSSRYPHIQAMVALRKEMADMGFIAINPKTGETVIKSAYPVNTKK